MYSFHKCKRKNEVITKLEEENTPNFRELKHFENYLVVQNSLDITTVTLVIDSIFCFSIFLKFGTPLSTNSNRIPQKSHYFSEVYSEHSQTSKMKIFCKNFPSMLFKSNGFHLKSVNQEFLS